MSPTTIAPKGATQIKKPTTVGGGTTLEEVKDLFKGEALAGAIQKADARHKMIRALGSYVDHDAFSTLNMVTAGEIYHHFLLQPLNTQKDFLTMMAKEMGVDPPHYAMDDLKPGEKRPQGRQETGRNQLVQILYGRYPAMLA